jgi:hypothetical protein
MFIGLFRTILEAKGIGEEGLPYIRYIGTPVSFARDHDSRHKIGEWGFGRRDCFMEDKLLLARIPGFY